MSSTAPALQNINIAAQNGVPFFSFGKSSGDSGAKNYDIGGIKIKAFFDSTQRLLFVIDETKDSVLPNALLVLAGNNGRKWDDILQNDFKINPETVRPRLNNKYQKLDIEYRGLDVFSNALAVNNVDALAAWRIATSKKIKESRKSVAGRKISIAKATAGEAEKTISEINNFIAAQKQKLKQAKENVGKESPKESAAKILRLESRIEKAIEKKKRAQRRQKRAQKRIDSSAKMLNNYASIMIEGRDYMAEVKPLFTENPNIIDTENAFKPVSFVPPSVATEPQIFQSVRPAEPAAPVFGLAQMARPVSPITGEGIRIEPAAASATGRQSGAYYLMLTMLIGLSIFTLYLYQKKMNSSEMPHIAAVVQEPIPAMPQAAIEQEPELPQIPETLPEPEMIPQEPVFIDEPAPVIAPEPIAEPEPVFEEPVIIPEQTPEIIEEPTVLPEPVPEIIEEPEFTTDEPAPAPDYNQEEAVMPEFSGDSMQYQQIESGMNSEPVEIAPVFEE